MSASRCDQTSKHQMRLLKGFIIGLLIINVSVLDFGRDSRIRFSCPKNGSFLPLILPKSLGKYGEMHGQDFNGTLADLKDAVARSEAVYRIPLGFAVERGL